MAVIQTYRLQRPIEWWVTAWSADVEVDGISILIKSMRSRRCATHLPTYDVAHATSNCRASFRTGQQKRLAELRLLGGANLRPLLCLRASPFRPNSRQPQTNRPYMRLAMRAPAAPPKVNPRPFLDLLKSCHNTLKPYYTVQKRCGCAVVTKTGGTVMSKSSLAFLSSTLALLVAIGGAGAEQLGTSAQAKAMI